jgi:signal transduction histidine kinase
MIERRVTRDAFENSMDDSVAVKLLDSLPITVAVLDEAQRVVFGEGQLMALINQLGEPAGERRFGDILCCVNAPATPHGCTTGSACTLCGANLAIQESRASGVSVTRECRIQYKSNSDYGAMDTAVTATPYTSRGRDYTLLTLQDLSHEKRRRSLERVFIHDLLNTAGGLTGLIQVMKEMDDPATITGFLADVERAGAQLLDEIMAQRQLLWAENKELSTTREDHDSMDILTAAQDAAGVHNVAVGRAIRISPVSEQFTIHTDRILLNRVLVNLARNGFEATHPPDVVTIGASQTDEDAVFTVHNPGVMSQDVQLQMFQRSFSTKGVGRGIGTYSVRLLTENYLGGSVDFTSAPDEGTTFRVRLPIKKKK